MKIIRELKNRGYKKLAAKIIALTEDEQKLNQQSAVLKFFKENPYPDDEAVHNFAEQIGADVHRVETTIYGLLTDFAKGVGKHTETPDSKFDPKELAAGIKIEMEHTDNPAIAKSIAKDHLSEIPDYYTRLIKMEKEAGIID